MGIEIGRRHELECRRVSDVRSPAIEEHRPGKCPGELDESEGAFGVRASRCPSGWGLGQLEGRMQPGRAVNRVKLLVQNIDQRGKREEVACVGEFPFLERLAVRAVR